MTKPNKFKEEQARKAAAREEAEKEKQRLEKAAAEAAEAARLQAIKQAEEEEKLKKLNHGKLPADNAKIKDITAWLNSIPLSEPVGKVERTFSDGVLLAEVISHFCPLLCDKRQYFKWNSSINKISNWELLNYKVFPKMGFRLKPHHINSILRPYSCGRFQKKCDGHFIYKLLERVRSVLADANRSVLDYKKANFVPPSASKIKLAKMGNKKKVSVEGYRDRRPSYSRVEMLVENGFYDRKGGESLPSRLVNGGGSFSNEQFSYSNERMLSPPRFDEDSIFVKPSMISCECRRPPAPPCEIKCRNCCAY